MNWIQLVGAFVLGLLTFFGYGLYLHYRSNKEIEQELIEEEQFIIQILEVMLLFGIEYEDITLFVIPTEIKGVLALKVAFHEEDNDIIEYAMCKGKEISLISPSEWAFVLGGDGVKAVPCLEDLDDIEGYFDAEEG
jgi:hypothetical protein